MWPSPSVEPLSAAGASHAPSCWRKDQERSSLDPLGGRTAASRSDRSQGPVTGSVSAFWYAATASAASTTQSATVPIALLPRLGATKPVAQGTANWDRASHLNEAQKTVSTVRQTVIAKLGRADDFIASAMLRLSLRYLNNLPISGVQVGSSRDGSSHLLVLQRGRGCGGSRAHRPD